MKRLIMLLVLNVTLSFFFIEAKNIDMKEEFHNKELRSINSTPVVTNEGNCFCVISHTAYKNLLIEVLNMNNEIVYSATASIYGGQQYSFQLDNIEYGTYKIVISTKENTYYGFFEMEEPINY